MYTTLVELAAAVMVFCGVLCLSNLSLEHSGCSIELSKCNSESAMRSAWNDAKSAFVCKHALKTCNGV